ncbi:GNAT family N-acetyltransferase [Psychrobacillus glaciei]|uniref:GNAT family N-acetyltransferase n=1 Tax=Psychrobacillus glaciei TaxID=2283160 RepID=A0A5J6SQI4_9BACI|nr:GNAT family N-acetyltransferase [Psychrobacillus glaciei]QFG00191.1 GNAT family N-acetyltransferase [Psychrobacillus glaciei]
MIEKVDISNLIVAKKVLNIQMRSYSVEAKIIDFYEIPPLKDTIDTLQQSGETFFGYYINRELCGVISIKIEKGIIDIHRLMVHPEHFKKGIASKLLDFIEKNKGDCVTIIVATGTKNEPAVTFYLKNGFLKTGKKMVTERLSLSFFKKKI